MEQWLKPENFMARLTLNPAFTTAIKRDISVSDWPTQELQTIWEAMLTNHHLGRSHEFKNILPLIEDKPTRLVFIGLYRNWDFMNTTVDFDWQMRGALECQA